MKLRLIQIAIFLFLPLALLAQPGDPGGNPDVPITGIEVLIALGGLLGIKRILGKDRKSKNE